jgi:hypothetical protein
LNTPTIRTTILKYLTELSYRHPQLMTGAKYSKKPSFTHEELSTCLNANIISELY